jgi:hypothetical protein
MDVMMFREFFLSTTCHLRLEADFEIKHVLLACRLQLIHAISPLSESGPVCFLDGAHITDNNFFAERVANLGRSGCGGKSCAYLLAGAPFE